MPIAGFSRFRYNQFGKQTVVGTPVAATVRPSWRGVPSVNPNWTNPDVDLGSIDPIAAPYRGVLDITNTVAGPLAYDDIPIPMNGGVRGGVTPSGAGLAKTWAHQALSLTATTLDYFTNESGDDFESVQAFGGVAESITFTMPEDLGPWQISTAWRFAGINPNVTPTASLASGSNSTYVMGDETKFYLDTTAGGIGGTQLVGAVHGVTLTIGNTIDVKRFADGSNQRNQASALALSGREITAAFTFAKTTATAAEVAAWLNQNPQNRYLKILSTTPGFITGSTPWSWDQRIAGRWWTKEDGEIGGNTTNTLMCQGFYDGTLGYAYRSSVVNSRAAI